MRVLRCIAVLTLFVLPIAAFSPLNAHAAETKKAKTIDELAKMYDSTGCKTCHEDIYKEWEQSIHSRSIFGTGRTAAT
ncbi:MAG TPA: multiheme c-type cytochrome, partial [Nitrospirota bacterium]|nr:multiheme c-type cytochrome [Nitrospirota bacterium]